MDDGTVFARASGAGRAGIAVIRVSGAAAGDGLARILGVARDALPSPRRASLRRLYDPGSTELLDEGLVLWFPGPETFTGEDMAELHVHGGPAVVEGVLGALLGIEGVRPAEPGEFSRRAFANGRIDLTQAEGIADLVDAETAAQRRQAQRQMAGALGDVYDGWRKKLIQIMSRLEATIDFSDEDLPEGADAEARAEVEALIAAMRAHLEDGRRGERLRDGVQVAILGPPNVGKSTILNRLAGRDAAIVSSTAGTTRDVVEVRMDLGGYPAVIADTAGLRDGGDEIEIEGMRRAVRRADDADLRVVVLEAAASPEVPDALRPYVDEAAVMVLNKADLAGAAGSSGRAAFGQDAHFLSAATGEGFDAFLDGLRHRVSALAELQADPALTRARHRQALEASVAHLAEAHRNWQGRDAELTAEDLRLAARHIGRITGHIDVEDILDVVFADFCIGK